jgi:hypothetical protein
MDSGQWWEGCAPARPMVSGGWTMFNQKFLCKNRKYTIGV